MPLAEPPRDSRFGSPLKLSRVLHGARPEVVVEVTYLSWTEDNPAATGVVPRAVGGQTGNAGRALYPASTSVCIAPPWKKSCLSELYRAAVVIHHGVV